jgi:AraC family transcriptional regulator
MQPVIKSLTEKKLVGKRITMSLADNKTFSLWQSFMPRRKEIANNLSADLFSMQVYHPSHDFTQPTQEFEKWAALEVTDFNTIPDGMEPFELVGGLYAVFLYQGLSTDTSIFRYIFGEWLVSSDYLLDNRPHFEILGEKYKNNDPNSEEEIWIPVKPKTTK